MSNTSDNLKRMDELIEKMEILSKPPTSEAQRKAMHAAAAGKSTLDIPKKVGKEFAGTDEGGKLPKKKSLKKHFEEIFGEGEELLTKADKDELFPEPMKADRAPVAVEFKQPKESVASQICYMLKELGEIRSASWSVQERNPEAKEAMQYHFDNKKKDLEKLIREFKTAKPMKKSEENQQNTLEKKEDLGVSIIHYHKSGKVLHTDHAPHMVAAKSKLLESGFSHVKNEGGKHYYKHDMDTNHTAVIFSTNKKENKMDKSDDETDSLDKSELLYHIHDGGQRITDQPLSIKQINTKHGGVKKLESSGFRLVQHTEPVKKSIDVYSLNETLSKVIKPNKPSPDSAYNKEYIKPSTSVQSQDESQAHTLKYSGNKITSIPPAAPKSVKPASTPKPPPVDAVATHAKVQQAKIKSGKSSFSAPKAADVIKERQKMKKSEVMMSVSSEELTKSLRKSHTDDQITIMLKAACDAGKIHRNTLLEWQNYKNVNISVLDLLDNME